VKYGLKAASITSVGKADKTPVADNNTWQGRAKNRRVVIIAKLTYKQAATSAASSLTPPPAVTPRPRDTAPPETTLRGSR
jgi:hypothetical protein